MLQFIEIFIIKKTKHLNFFFQLVGVEKKIVFEIILVSKYSDCE